MHVTADVTTVPRNPVRGQLAITQTCSGIIASLLAFPAFYAEPACRERLGAAAAEWVAQGIDVETVHRALREAVDDAAERLVAESADADPQLLESGIRRLFGAYDVAVSLMTTAYVQLSRPVPDAPSVPLRARAKEIADQRDGSGESADPQRRERYAVVAVSIPASDERPDLDGVLTARRTLRRLQIALADRLNHSATSVLGLSGGTLLLPAAEAGQGRMRELLADLSRAVRTPLTATVVYGPRADVRPLADRAHELLDIVHRFRYPSGLYRFRDLALEYQLTRDGSARERLSRVLIPLDEFPDLLETLQVLIRTDMSRRDTARILAVHRNTVDYRLRRIKELTGYDPTGQTGMWYLQSAVAVRAYRAGTGSGITNRLVEMR